MNQFAKPDQGRGTLASSVYDRLRGDILTGILSPGEKLRTKALRVRYGVGNSPLREALNRLSVGQLVTREDQKGFRVATASHAELKELVRTRCWLEEIVLRESISKGDEAWEENLLIAYHRLTRVKRSLDDHRFELNPDWWRLHRIFHTALLDACGSRWMMQFCTQLYDQGERYCQLAGLVTYDVATDGDEHEAIMKAAVARDADEAVRLIHNHYRGTQQIICDAISDFSENALAFKVWSLPSREPARRETASARLPAQR